MELYVDNQKVNLKPKRYKTLGMVINDIRIYLLNNNKIPHKFYINGETLDEHTIVSIENLKVIEVETKSETDILFESILRAKTQIEKFIEFFDEEIYEDNPLVINENDLLEKGVFLKWFFNLLLIIKATKDLDFIYEDFNEYVQEFANELGKSEEAFENKDYETYLEIIEFSILDLLKDFYENADTYFIEVVNEENRKRLLN